MSQNLLKIVGEPFELSGTDSGILEIVVSMESGSARTGCQIPDVERLQAEETHAPSKVE